MKLLFFIYSLRGGGAERVTVNLANHWAANGQQVTILTLLPQPFDFYQLHPAVRRISLNLVSDGGNVLTGVWNNARRVLKLRRVLRGARPDIALSMMTTANVLLALATCRMTNIVTIGCERSYPPAFVTPGSAWGRLRRWTYGKLTAVAAQTKEAKAWLDSNTRARRVAVIPNAVQLPLSIEQPVVKPEDFAHSSNRVLLTVGRLEPEKGFDWLIDAFATLAPKHPTWVLVILGEGTQRKPLEAQLSKRGLDTKVFLPGVVGNVAQWYARADVYSSTSRSEGFPNALMEALAHGLPAVSFDYKSGPGEIIRHGIDGFIVPLGNLPAFAAALDQLMSDETVRRQFAGHAAEVRDRFSMERITSAWEALFLETLQK